MLKTIFQILFYFFWFLVKIVTYRKFGHFTHIPDFSNDMLVDVKHYVLYHNQALNHCGGADWKPILTDCLFKNMLFCKMKVDIHILGQVIKNYLNYVELEEHSIYVSLFSCQVQKWWTLVEHLLVVYLSSECPFYYQMFVDLQIFFLHSPGLVNFKH